VWQGTREETAYALHSLCDLPAALRSSRWEAALQDGADFLGDTQADGPEQPTRQHLWHGKELYTPTRVVEAMVLTAVYTVVRHYPQLKPGRALHES
jgi:hypothetical protein